MEISKEKIFIKSNWKKIDIIWFVSQLLILLTINIILITQYDSLWIAIVSLIATLSGSIGTYLAVKKYSINYLFGIIHVCLYGLIAFVSNVFGDFALNILIFLPMDIIGWIFWKKYNVRPVCECPSLEECDCKKDETIINKLSINQIIISIIILLLSTLVLSLILYYFNDPAAILDAMSTVISIFGMWLMVKYYREQWWVWLLVNLVSVGIWIQVLFTGDLIAIPFIAMWSIYVFNSIIGIKEWNKQ